MNAELYLCIVLIVLSLTAIGTFYYSFVQHKREFRQLLEIDISKEQMDECESKIKAVLEKNNIKPGAPISTIAKALNVEDKGIDKEMSDIARLDKPNYEGVREAFFKYEHHDFDLAHEIGHIINNDPLPATRPNGVNKPQAEQLADYIGAALLMPIDSVYQDLIAYKYASISRHKKTIALSKLSQKYNVSEIMALRRIKEIYRIKSGN